MAALTGHTFRGPLGAEARTRLTDWLPIYVACFSGPPWHDATADVAAYHELVGGDFAEPGFRAFEAVADDGALLGVAYGWHHERSAARGTVRLLDQALGADADAFWARDPIGVAEVMVAPEARRRGIAQGLLDLLAPPHQAAWLATHVDSEANGFYRRTGWASLGTATAPSGVPLRFYERTPEHG